MNHLLYKVLFTTEKVEVTVYVHTNSRSGLLEGYGYIGIGVSIGI